jgi:glucose-1-phosphate adenylyltransferase
MKDVLAMIMAGGAGERLYPLTKDRAKPAVPFGGIYRLIDITLSNCVNSNVRKIVVLTQYKSLSLERHIMLGWHIFNPELDEFIITLQPQMRISNEWYKGTADSIYQNFYFIDGMNPKYVLILSGDHVYKMNYAEMLEYHILKKADITVSVVEVDVSKTSMFGIATIDEDFRIIGFEEKPKHLKDPSRIYYANMGVYIFNTNVLKELLEEDAKKDTQHDFGKNILPGAVGKVRVFAYNFKDENKKEVKYWRDVGTIDAYYEANMDLVSVDPLFNLYDKDWPIRTYWGRYPPAKTVFAQEYPGGRLGIALDSIVSGGCIISGGRVQNCVLSPNVRINSYADVRESILFEGVNIGRYCKIRRAIIDKEVNIPPGTVIGYDIEEDRKRYFVTDSHIVVIPRGISVAAKF